MKCSVAGFVGSVVLIKLHKFKKFFHHLSKSDLFNEGALTWNGKII